MPDEMYKDLFFISGRILEKTLSLRIIFAEVEIWTKMSIFKIKILGKLSLSLSRACQQGKRTPHK